MKSISKWLILCFISLTILSCNEDDTFVFVPGEYTMQEYRLIRTETRNVIGSMITASLVRSLDSGNVIIDFKEDGSFTINGTGTMTETYTSTNEEPETSTYQSTFDDSGTYIVNETENIFTLNGISEYLNDQEMTVTSFSNNQFTIEINLDITTDSEQIVEETYQVKITVTRQ